MKFIQLLNPYVLDNSGIQAVESQQAEAMNEFPKMITRTQMRYWKPGQSISQIGNRFLLGVAASFDLKDLRLIDLVEEYFSREKNATIDVFNLDDCDSIENLNLYYPGSFSGVPGNPILGQWSEGIHVGTCCGMQARMRVLEILGLVPDFPKYFGDLNSPTKKAFE
ncbi:MAG: hypothetical protein ABL888_12250 [Pirellulaceae bacterium]